MSTPAAGAGVVTCRALTGSPVRALGQSCSIVEPGMHAQSDDCAPGLVCLQASCGATCFRHCRVDADCGGKATCTKILPGEVKLCDVEPVVCNPVTVLGQSGCASAAQGCYLSATVADETKCDCPSNGHLEGQPCTVSRDCLPGLVCADPYGQNDFVCRPACRLGAPPTGCNAPQTCTLIRGSKTYGFCD